MEPIQQEQSFQENQNKKPFVERRRKPDFFNTWIRISSVVVWFIFFVFLSVADRAKPITESFFDRLFGVTRSTNWDSKYLAAAFVIVLILFCLSVVSLFFNSFRLKRKDDRIRISLVLNFIFSLIVIFLYVYYYYTGLK